MTNQTAGQLRILKMKSNQNCERGWNNRSRYKVHESKVDMRQLQQDVCE